MVSLRHANFILSAIAGCALSTTASAFVLLSATEEAILEVSPESPTIAFTLRSEHPGLEDIGEYEGGAYAGMSEDELWPILVQHAMDKWNEIRGAYIELQINPAGTAVFDSEDRVHSIVVGDQGFTSAALANPVVEDGKIIDCDIKVGTRSVSATSLFYTLVHELGHCLGLGHNHTNYGSIMSYSRDARTSKLGADDVAGAIYLYPNPAVIDEDSKEAIGCGVTGINKNNQAVATWLLFLLPLLFIAAKKRLTNPKPVRVRRR